MPESLKEYRAHFIKKGAQQKWLTKTRVTLSVTEMALICSCSERTIRDWQKEKFHMDYKCVELLSNHLKIPMPIIKKVDKYAHTQRAGKLGATAVIKKFGRIPVDENLRTQKWSEWWGTKGKYQKNSITSPRKIKRPRQSKDLAEFCGIVLGDGGITDYQVTITLNLKDDTAYAVFIVRLCEKLFGFSPGVYIRKENNTQTILLSRVEVVRFLTKHIGLVKGNKVKHRVSIPEWIMEKNSYQIACLRGLVDTDGSIFTHRYTVNRKQYAYKKLSFSSASVPLKSDVHKILKVLGMNPRLAGKFDVRLDSKIDMSTYFNLVNSSNPKHLKRYKK